MKEKKPIRIFISFAAADREVARRIISALASANARVFATDMLSAGGNWQAKLRDEITESDLFVLVFSNETRRSDFVLQELGAALALDKPIVVIHEQSPFSNPNAFHPGIAIASHHNYILDQLRDPEIVKEILSLPNATSEPDAAAS